MARGQVAKVGAEYVAPNGYHYVRTETKWRLKHHIVAEQLLGRPIRPDETVRFKDGDRSNLDPDNIMVTPRRTSLRGQLAKVEAKIMELESERDLLRAQIARLDRTKQNGKTS